MKRVEPDDWPTLRDKMARVCFKRGIDDVADAIPADRATVYRLINGTTQHPTLAVRARIEQLVGAEDRKQQTTTAPAKAP